MISGGKFSIKFEVSPQGEASGTESETEVGSYNSINLHVSRE